MTVHHMTTASALAVTPGPFAVTDADGNALCHGARQTRRSLNNARRNMTVLAPWEEALTMAGLMSGDRVVCTDGVTRSRGRGEDRRDGFADFGHIVADSLDGAFCGCNAVPVEGSQNRADGDCRPAIAWTPAQVEAYRASFRIVALRNMTGTKRSRAV